MLVAHRATEEAARYRDAAHSHGSQQATIAILLLATMGTAEAADLLIMDERIAHLDSTNIDHVANLAPWPSGSSSCSPPRPTPSRSASPGATSSSPSCPATRARPTAPIRLLSRIGVSLEERAPEQELSTSG